MAKEKRYLKYNKATGQVVTIYTFTPHYDAPIDEQVQYLLDLNDTESYIEAPPDKVYNARGTYKVNYSSGVIEDLTPLCPGPEYYYDFVETKWSIRTEVLIEKINRDRNKLLADTDWIVAKYTELGQPIPENYRVYRQALRDITLQPGYPENIVWPILGA